MILLDAYAVLAFLLDEPAAAEVERLLRRGESGLTLVNLAEVLDVSCRVHSLAVEDVRDVLEPLVAARELALVAPAEETAWRAARLRIAHYDGKERPLSLADCFLLAAAGPEDRVAAADPSVAHVARSESIGLLPLPDTRGKRP